MDPTEDGSKIIAAPAFKMVTVAVDLHTPRLPARFSDQRSEELRETGTSREYPIPLIPGQLFQPRQAIPRGA
jgi:hypothetical protein